MSKSELRQIPNCVGTEKIMEMLKRPELNDKSISSVLEVARNEGIEGSLVLIRSRISEEAIVGCKDAVHAIKAGTAVCTRSKLGTVVGAKPCIFHSNPEARTLELPTTEELERMANETFDGVVNSELAARVTNILSLAYRGPEGENPIEFDTEVAFKFFKCEYLDGIKDKKGDGFRIKCFVLSAVYPTEFLAASRDDPKYASSTFKRLVGKDGTLSREGLIALKGLTPEGFSALPPKLDVESDGKLHRQHFFFIQKCVEEGVESGT